MFFFQEPVCSQEVRETGSEVMDVDAFLNGVQHNPGISLIIEFTKTYRPFLSSTFNPAENSARSHCHKAHFPGKTGNYIASRKIHFLASDCQIEMVIIPRFLFTYVTSISVNITPKPFPFNHLDYLFILVDTAQF